MKDGNFSKIYYAVPKHFRKLSPCTQNMNEPNSQPLCILWQGNIRNTKRFHLCVKGEKQLLFQAVHGGRHTRRIRMSACFVWPDEGDRSLRCVGTIKFTEGIKLPLLTFFAFCAILYFQGQRTLSVV